MPEWTTAQKNAIDSRKGTILVSAAAGSGKTTVLVERVIQRIEDKENPCPADKLLIVTFTRAATSQMKEKITAALEKRLEENPADEHLLTQRILLPFAHISTIDSFCSEIVRENFHEVGIAPDYKMLEETELMIMKSDAVNTVLERAYNEPTEGFTRLLSMFAKDTGDSDLGNLIISLYDSSRAFSQPDKWIRNLTEPYNCQDFKSSVWGKVISEYLGDVADYCIQLMTTAINTFAENDCVCTQKFTPLFIEYTKCFSNFLDAVNNKNWDEITESLDDFITSKIVRISPKESSIYTDKGKAIKKEVCDIVKMIKKNFFICTESEFVEDTAFLKPAVEELVKLIEEFEKEFSSLKNAVNGADFTDIVALTLKLLVSEIDEYGNPVKTELAEEISSRFNEILVDEFQDINETQNLLFKAVSQNENNLFMVGDVKQSIYKFRQAMPEIFLKRRMAMDDYVDGNYPAKINLDYNFRSRKGVTDFVNFLFTQLMSVKAGELDYDENEALKPHASYSEHSAPDAHIHIITNPCGRINRTHEAEYVAEYIKNEVGKTLVKDGDGERPSTYKDFCILLRSTKNRAEIYSTALAEKGIPCYVSSRNGFFDTTEIRTALSIMRIVDNPLQDIPLAAALISPIFGFTPDELSLLRAENPYGSYYYCVKNAAEQGKRKCADFIKEIKRLRTLSATLGAGEFVREMLDSTGYSAIVCAMDNGSQRKANLSLLLDYAEKYEQSGHSGLSGFIRFIDKVQTQQGDFEIANEISESADVVQIMSIHNSKGLEYPICILADCSSKFNQEDLKRNAIFSPKYGIAFKRVDGYKKFDTLPFRALVAAQQRSDRSEELRVLYVALTRAKEKLVCIIRNDNPEENLTNMMHLLNDNVKIHPFKVLYAQSAGDWILTASIKHKDSNSLNCISSARTVKTIKSDSDVSFKIADVEFTEAETLIEFIELSDADTSIISFIKERSEYEYPYEYLSTLSAKVSPSQLEKNEESLKYFASAKPDFLNKDGMKAASKGTAVHKFMEFYDYSSDLTPIEQAEKMVKENKLSENENAVLNFTTLCPFFESEIAKRIKNSAKLEREKRITTIIPANEIYTDITDADEKILVQGYIDCAFIENGKWVIVDYKTDRVKIVDELKERYYSQLKMYERVLFECSGIPVKETVIYSLHLNTFITI